MDCEAAIAMPLRKECNGLTNRINVLPILLKRVKRLLNRLQHSSITNSLASESLVEDAIFHSLSRVGAEVRFLDETIERYLSRSDPDTGNIVDGPKRLLAFAPASRNKFLINFTTEQTLGFSRELSTAFVINVGPDAKSGYATERRPDYKPLSNCHIFTHINQLGPYSDDSCCAFLCAYALERYLGRAPQRHKRWPTGPSLREHYLRRLLAQWERPSSHPTKDRSTQVLVAHQGMDDRVSVDKPKQRHISDVEQSSEPKTSGRSLSQLSEALHEKNNDVGFGCQAHGIPRGAFHSTQKASHQRQFSSRLTPNSKPSSKGGRERDTTQAANRNLRRGCDGTLTDVPRASASHRVFH
ncbi:hypothetical protein CKAH01_17139 [Colletotrichum kahawae]|uniref:Uncharacterized protein n=1 Tax=Colletotrichum kahawae TaxID=34407 RepID=A0AAD9YBM4_COLKA|nr:hypothetical protein CKAH01_17139 [Colletotrichum kahawae]